MAATSPHLLLPTWGHLKRNVTEGILDRIPWKVEPTAAKGGSGILRGDGWQRLSETVILPTSQGAKICLSKSRDSYQNNYKKKKKNCCYPCIVIAIVPGALKILPLILTTALQSVYFLSCKTEVQESKIAPKKSISGRMRMELIPIYLMPKLSLFPGQRSYKTV